VRLVGVDDDERTAPFVSGQHGLGVMFKRREAFSQCGFAVIGPASRPKTFGNCCERHGQENGERNGSGLSAFERFRLREIPREPVEEHHRCAFALELGVDEIEREAIGHEVAGVDERPHFETKRRAAGNVLTQRVAQREVRGADFRRDPCTLGALSGAGPAGHHNQ